MRFSFLVFLCLFFQAARAEVVDDGIRVIPLPPECNADSSLDCTLDNMRSYRTNGRISHSSYGVYCEAYYEVNVEMRRGFLGQWTRVPAQRIDLTYGTDGYQKKKTCFSTEICAQTVKSGFISSDGKGMGCPENNCWMATVKIAGRTLTGSSSAAGHCYWPTFMNR